jgi:hypothetical protein
MMTMILDQRDMPSQQPRFHWASDNKYKFLCGVGFNALLKEGSAGAAPRKGILGWDRRAERHSK